MKPASSLHPSYFRACTRSAAGAARMNALRADDSAVDQGRHSWQSRALRIGQPCDSSAQRGMTSGAARPTGHTQSGPTPCTNGRPHRALRIGASMSGTKRSRQEAEGRGLGRPPHPSGSASPQARRQSAWPAQPVCLSATASRIASTGATWPHQRSNETAPCWISMSIPSVARIPAASAACTNPVV